MIIGAELVLTTNPTGFGIPDQIYAMNCLQTESTNIQKVTFQRYQGGSLVEGFGFVTTTCNNFLPKCFFNGYHANECGETTGNGNFTIIIM